MLHRKTLLRLALVVWALLPGGCGDLAGDLGGDPRPIIYDADDRREFYRGTPAQKGAAAAVFLVVKRRDLGCNKQRCRLRTVRFTNSYYSPLCKDEPFRLQPTVGHCSAFLVGPDLMATAGHCIAPTACSNTFFVPRFRKDGPGSPPPPAVLKGQILRCKSLVVRRFTWTEDYAIWRLARKATGITPLCIRRSGTVSTGTGVLVIGHPVTLPQKIAGGATVKGVGSSYFEADLDAYGGNSGSPVLDAATLTVQGILVRGAKIWPYDSAEGCYRSGTCSGSSGCSGYFEECSHARDLAAQVPATTCYRPANCATDADCDDSNPCSADRCITGACSHRPANAGSSCRPATGACDRAEACDGLSIDCPDNGFIADGTSCGGSGGSCGGGICRR